MRTNKGCGAIPFERIARRHAELADQLSGASLAREKRQELQRELSYLARLMEKGNDIEAARAAYAEVLKQAESEKDEQMLELYREETSDLEQKVTALCAELDLLMAPPNEHDERSVYLEIRAGTGGQEAALFAADLLKMYTNYALKKHWRVNVESESETDLGGYREVVLHIQGKNVYGYLKHESGVHRVQRVPHTEAAGRIHTSTATVAVLPEAKEVDVSIEPSDLRIDVFRASGAGGQHVNTTDSAVRITHIPSGVVVSCQDERSQHKNKATAMKMLKSRILAARVEAKQAEESAQRREQVGTGGRSEKVRTYNFPQNRVTDHQVNVTLKKLDMVMQGDLDEIIDALRLREYEVRRMEFVSRFIKT